MRQDLVAAPGVAEGPAGLREVDAVAAGGENGEESVEEEEREEKVPARAGFGEGKRRSQGGGGVRGTRVLYLLAAASAPRT